MFKNIDRKNKRWHQVLLTSRLNDQCKLNPKLNNGEILVLSGPDPQKAIKYYQRYKMYDFCTLVENNRSVFEQARLNFNLAWGNHTLIFDDVFVIANVYKHLLRGIDFDFCTTLKDELVKKIAYIMSNLQKPCVWFRVTSSHRGIKTEELQEKQQAILHTIEKFSDYTVTDEASVNYRDGCCMNVWQIVLRNNRKMEEGTMRTLKDMTQAEQEMARTLVNKKYSSRQETSYDDNDISRVLQMSPYSVSALKAHVTMRKQNR